MGKQRQSHNNTKDKKTLLEAFEFPCLICFVDLIGSSIVSSELRPLAYWWEYMRSFYLAIERAMRASQKIHLTEVYEGDEGKLQPDWDYRGDELVGFVPLGNQRDKLYVGAAVGYIIRFIYGLRLFWLGACRGTSCVRS